MNFRPISIIILVAVGFLSGHARKTLEQHLTDAKRAPKGKVLFLATKPGVADADFILWWASQTEKLGPNDRVIAYPHDGEEPGATRRAAIAEQLVALSATHEVEVVAYEGGRGILLLLAAVIARVNHGKDQGHAAHIALTLVIDSTSQGRLVSRIKDEEPGAFFQASTQLLAEHALWDHGKFPVRLVDLLDAELPTPAEPLTIIGRTLDYRLGAYQELLHLGDLGTSRYDLHILFASNQLQTQGTLHTLDRGADRIASLEKQEAFAAAQPDFFPGVAEEKRAGINLLETRILTEVLLNGQAVPVTQASDGHAFAKAAINAWPAVMELRFADGFSYKTTFYDARAATDAAALAGRAILKQAFSEDSQNDCGFGNRKH